MKNYRNLSSVIRQVVTEAHTKDHPPFDGPYKKFKGDIVVTDKSGAVHNTQMSKVKDLARKAMQKIMGESFGLDITYEEADDLLNSIQEAGVYNRASAQRFLKNIKPKHKPEYNALLKKHNWDGSYADHAAVINSAAKLGHLTTGNDNPDHDIKEESTRMKEWNYTPKQHREEAAEHLKDAKAHEAAGNKSKHHAAMMDYHNSMMQASAKELPPIRGTFKSNEFGDR